MHYVPLVLLRGTQGQGVYSAGGDRLALSHQDGEDEEGHLRGAASESRFACGVGQREIAEVAKNMFLGGIIGLFSGMSILSLVEVFFWSARGAAEWLSGGGGEAKTRIMKPRGGKSPA